VRDVEITADAEGRDDLATGLFDRGEVDARPVGDVEADLLPELASCGDPWVFVFCILALGNRPRTLVLARPERSTWMADQHFGTVVEDSVQQETCAAFRHGSA